MVPPSTVAKERGRSTLEGDTPRRLHQPSTTGSRVATIGVLGTNADTGATTATIRAIIRLGVRIASEPIAALRRSRPPERNRPAERANRPIKVTNAGLPNPSTASPGFSTPVAISNPAASRPVTSGASQPDTNRTIAPARIAKVIWLAGSVRAVMSDDIAQARDNAADTTVSASGNES